MKLKKRVLSLIVSAGLIFTSAMPAYTVAAAEPPGNAGFSNYITVSGTKLMDGENELRFVSLNYPQATSDTPWEHAIQFRCLTGRTAQQRMLQALIARAI